MPLQVISNIVESALQNALIPVLGKVPVLISDVGPVGPYHLGNKVPMPYLVLHADSYADQINGEIFPGSGIFKVSVTTLLRSHAAEDGTANRDAMVSAINQFMYQPNQANPAAARLQAAVTLSAFPNLYVHGFVPTSGQMRVNPELKAYEYLVQCDLYCKPSSGP